MKRVVFLFFLVILLVAPLIAEAQEVEIINLYDAFGNKKEGATLDWGFSALIRYRGKTILFDAGLNADTFAKNVKALGVDLNNVDFAVLSHRHSDHLSGFDHLLTVHPSVKLFLPEDRTLGARTAYPIEHPGGLPPEEMYFRGEKDRISFESSGRFWRANVDFVGANKEIAPGVFLVVTESPLTGEYWKYPPNDAEPLLLTLPELSLALMTDEGMVLIVGCSHSKVEVIARQAKAYLRRDLELVMGGFHLLPYDADYITALARMMKEKLGVRRVAPAHCTGHLGFKILREVYGEDYLFAGLSAKITLSPQR